MGAVEKVAHRSREVPQRPLLHGLRPGRQPVVFGAGRSQLGTLIVVIRCSAARLPVLLLLDGQIDTNRAWRQCPANAADCSVLGSNRNLHTPTT